MAVQKSLSQCKSTYQFVTPPDEDFICPVSFEVLIDPVQTECCGKHISFGVKERLVGSFCPLCKQNPLVTHKDKYFQRKVLQLQVYCQFMCSWKGELKAFDEHVRSCPRSPWKCQYCDFEAQLWNKEAHINVCAKYPVVCPNKCEIGTVPRCDTDTHIEVCPLQPVKCDYASAGCTELVPRNNVKKHVAENAVNHLFSATLLNLRLTTELQADTSRDILYATRGFSRHKFSFTHVSQVSKSDLFYSFPGEYCFSFEINTTTVENENRYRPVLNIECGPYNNSLKWPVTCTVHLYLLNQRGNHNHLMKIYTITYSRVPWRTWYEWMEDSENCYSLATLAYNAENNTEYCVNGCLKYILYIKTSND